MTKGTSAVWLRRAVVWFALLPMIVTYSGAGAHARAPEAAPDAAADILESALAGIQSNYAQIKTAKCVFRQVIRNSGVDQLVGETRVVRNGVVRVASTPRHKETLIDLTLRGDDYRYERRAEDGANPASLEVHAGDRWTQFTPDGRAGPQAWIRGFSQLPHVAPRDIRNFFGDREGIPLVDLLRKSKMTSATLKNAAAGGVVAEIDTTDPHGQRIVYQFDAEKNFVPTSATHYWPDGSTQQFRRLSYAPVLGGKAYFPTGAVRFAFPKGGGDPVALTGWSQSESLDLVGDLEINDAVSDAAFQPAFPVGTQVDDVVAGKIYSWGEQAVGPDRSSYALPFALCVTAVLVIAIVVVLVHGKRSAA